MEKEKEEKQFITDFTHMSPLFQANRIRRNKQVVILPSIEREDDTMVLIDREHEIKKKKHNAILGRNFFIQSSNHANRSIIKATTGRIPRRRIVPLLNTSGYEEPSDVIDWNQVHKSNDIIENKNDNIVILSRIINR